MDRNEEVLTNVRRIPDKVMEGAAITEFEIEIPDWDKRIEEYRKRIETEARERIEKINKKEIKEKSWQLYKECQKFLEDNERNWELEKLEREAERKKKERISEAKAKQEAIRVKVRERNLESELNKKLNELPIEEKNRIKREEELQRKRNYGNSEGKKESMKENQK